MRKYMVVESFRPGCIDKVDARFEAQGRPLHSRLTKPNQAKFICR